MEMLPYKLIGMLGLLNIFPDYNMVIVWQHYLLMHRIHISFLLFALLF